MNLYLTRCNTINHVVQLLIQERIVVGNNELHIGNLNRRHHQ